jgi:beta-glucosidase
MKTYLVFAISLLLVGLTGGATSSSASSRAPDDLPWMNQNLSPARRTELLLDAMTLDQKLGQIYNLPVYNADLDAASGGDENDGQGCDFTPVGRHIEGIPELRIPDLRFANGGTGIRGGDCVPEQPATGLPSGPASAATFNRMLNYRWGRVLGAEVRAWAHPVLWGPGINLIRTPYGGRNHEYLSEDPYLTGAIASQQVRGVQSRGDVQATIKHFVANEQEYQFERWTAASRVPSRAMHELYLLPFEMAVKDARPASVMCAYPDVNFQHACQNKGLLTTTLRKRWGFDGYVVSDRRAMWSTLPSIRAGTQWELDETPVFYQPEIMKDLIDSGAISEATIDSMLRDRFRKMFAFGLFDEPEKWSSFHFGRVDYAAHAKVARKAGVESTVLLKNDGLLPLKARSIDSVALIGAPWFAGQASMPPRSGDREEMSNVVTDPARTISPEQGLHNTLDQLGSDATVTYNDGTDVADAAALAADSDVAVLMVGDLPRETWDKTTLALPEVVSADDDGNVAWEVDQEALVEQVLAANPRTVVVLKTSHGVLMPWLGRTRALVEAWNPGQDDGNVVADMLFGVTNPSGKLPMTFFRTTHEAAWRTQREYPGIREANGEIGGPGREGCDPEDRDLPECQQLVTFYDENLELGYRWYEATGTKPLFAFGHGLSYTRFRYSRLAVAKARKHGQPVLRVSFTVKNTGDRVGREAPQVYLDLPKRAHEPSQRLVGFTKFKLRPGQSRRARVVLDTRASNHPMSYWVPKDPENLRAWARGEWATLDGRYRVAVGSASDRTPLHRKVRVSARNNPPMARPMQLTAAPGQASTIRLRAVDPDGDALTYRIGGQAAGRVQVVGKGQVRLRSAAGGTDPTSFVFTVSDGHGGTDSARVTVRPHS